MHACFIDNIWLADLADMPLISKFREGFRFLLRVSDNYSKFAFKYALFILLVL